MLTVKRIHAGRGAVDYYLNQTRHGLADYYLTEASHDGTDGRRQRRARPSAPGASWWGGGAAALELGEEVERGQFVPLFARGVRPGGGYLGRRFRLPEEVDATKAEATRFHDDKDAYTGTHHGVHGASTRPIALPSRLLFTPSVHTFSSRLPGGASKSRNIGNAGW